MRNKEKKESSIDYRTEAQPRTMAGDVPVFCAHDELLPLEKIIPNPLNPNTHPQDQIKLLSQIIKAQGWRAPITVSTRSGYIVAGHGRLMAAYEMGAKVAPVDYQNFSSEAEEYAALVADNRLAELAEISNTMLAEILSEIDTGELPLELTGYTEEDLEGILGAIAGEDDAEPDDKDNELEQPTTPMCKKGDIWELGEHRLIIGDSTNEETIERLMNGEKATMVHTDPPYGVSYTGGFGKEWDGIKDDDTTEDELVNKVLHPVFSLYRKYTIDKAAFYIWHSDHRRRDFEDAMRMAGLMERQSIVWVKNNINKARNHYQNAHESCFYACKEGEVPNFYGDRKQHSVWRVTTRIDGQMMTVLGGGLVLTDGMGNKIYIAPKAPKGKKVRYARMECEKPVDIYQEDRMNTVWEVARETNCLHPTQKPVELAIRAIENSSNPGEIVIDFFGGSGSTLLGAEKTGRVCYMAEIEPQYGDVIVSRYVLETGNIGVTCTRDGEKLSYIDMVRQWAKDNGKEEELAGMKTPVVVCKRGNATTEPEEPEEEWEV